MRTELKDGEQVVLEIRKHWFVLVSSMVFLLAAITAVFFVLYKGTDGFNIALVVLALAVFNFIYRFYDRNLNIWAVTNMRVIDEWGVFSHNAKESPLDKIHNVSYEQSLAGRIFGFGDVKIQTAAEQGATVNRFVMSPKMLKNTIVECQDSYKELLVNQEAEKMFSAIKSHDSAAASQDGTKECPYCAEIIKAKAKICRFCGRELDPEAEEVD